MTISILYFRQQGISSGSIVRATTQYRQFSLKECELEIALTDSIIHRLINRRLHPPPLLTNIPDLSHLPRRIVAQPKLYKLALLMQFIDPLQRLLIRHRAVRAMQVVYIHAVSTELFQRRLALHSQVLGLVCPGLSGRAFGGEGQAAGLPVGGAREGFLEPGDVDAGCVDFVVAPALESVEDFVVFVEGGDSGAFGFVGAWGWCYELVDCARKGRYLPKVINPRMTLSVGFCAIRGILTIVVLEKLNVEWKR